MAGFFLIMAISTSYDRFIKDFNPNHWKSIEEFIEYKLLRISEQGSFYHNYYTDENGIETHIPPIDHFPKLKEYEIWCEGYRATGESEEASLMGKVLARNFTQACHLLMCQRFIDSQVEINSPNCTKNFDIGRWDYDPSKLRYWNCGLFWSKELAMKSFG